MEKDDYYSNAFSPSFSTYSGDQISETAERVSRTFIGEDDGFEFLTLATSSSIDVGGGVLFPVFNQSLIADVSSPETVITPLKDLFLRESNEQPPQQTYSSSSDEEEEEDEFDDAIPCEIYSPWTPTRSTPEMSPSGGCRKSKSTGSSATKRWRIRDLLKRSNSDGKQSIKFINTNSESSKKKKKEKVVSVVSAHEKFYLRNKAMKEEEKRKSYLPYKQDLVGIFSNINRYGKTFTPF